MDISIRKAVKQDFNTLLTLFKDFSVFQKTPHKLTITLAQMIDDEKVFQCLVAETKTGEIIGYATYFFAYYSWSGKGLSLDDLYVVENYRKHGIGKRLLDSVIQLASDSGCKKVRWQVSKWNTPAIAFYKSIGAMVTDTEINCDFNLTNE